MLTNACCCILEALRDAIAVWKQTQEVQEAVELCGNKLKKFMKRWNFVYRVKLPSKQQIPSKGVRKYIKLKKTDPKVRCVY